MNYDYYMKVYTSIQGNNPDDYQIFGLQFTNHHIIDALLYDSDGLYGDSGDTFTYTTTDDWLRSWNLTHHDYIVMLPEDVFLEML